MAVKLPGSSQPVIVSSHNSVGDGRYFDVESSSSFLFDHATQVSEPWGCDTSFGGPAAITQTTNRKLARFRATCWRARRPTWCELRPDDGAAACRWLIHFGD